MSDPARAQASSVVVVSPDDLRALIAEAVATALNGAVRPAAPADTPEYLTTREAAALLGVSMGTLEHLRTKRQGPSYIRIGNAIRYRRADLERPGQSDPDPALVRIAGAQFVKGDRR
jgi:excisionase family DNA binding protein